MKKTWLILLILNLLVIAKGQTNVETVAKNDVVEVKKTDSVSTNPIAEKTKAFNVTKFSASPVIDGKLDDEIWRKAIKLVDFTQYQPGDGADASKQTTVYLGYDEKHLYIGIHALDERDQIRATVAQRDRIFDEDYVRLFLDTFGDQRRAYVIGFNPLGIQGDGIFTEGSNEPDLNVDILMESKGMIVADGWTVEARIPFKSLRYKAGKDKFWGVHVFRKIARINNEQDSWMPINKNINGLLVQAGKLTGLDEIKGERTLEIVPTVTFKETGRRLSPTKFSNPPIQADYGFTLKYKFNSNITLDAAVNPDFADVEADAPVVEVNQRFPIFFDEKRPFFQEGVEIFRTPISAVNTRQIQNPDLALKLTGKVGKNSFGVMAAVDDPISGNPLDKRAYVGVLRLKRDFGKESGYGFLATSYNFPNKRNQIGGFDFRWKIDSTKVFSGQILATHSRNFFYDPNLNKSAYRTGNGLAYSYDFSDTNKRSSWGFSGIGRTIDYRADVSLARRTNTNRFAGFKNWYSNPEPKSFLIRYVINSNYSFHHDFQGRFQYANANLAPTLSLRGNLTVGGGIYVGGEKLIEEEFGTKRTATRKGAFFGEPDRTTTEKGFWLWTEKTFSKRFSANANLQMNYDTFDLDFGGGAKFPRVSPAALANPNNPQDPGSGNQWVFNLGAGWKPTDNLRFNLNLNKTKLTRNDTGLVAFDSNIVQFRTTYQFSRFISLKTRLDYNTLNNRLFGQYTFGWTPSPGKALYVGYNDRWSNHGYEYNPRVSGLTQLDRTFFIKFSYLFRKSF